MSSAWLFPHSRWHLHPPLYRVVLEAGCGKVEGVHSAPPGSVSGPPAGPLPCRLMSPPPRPRWRAAPRGEPAPSLPESPVKHKVFELAKFFTKSYLPLRRRGGLGEPEPMSRSKDPGEDGRGESIRAASQFLGHGLALAGAAALFGWVGSRIGERVGQAPPSYAAWNHARGCGRVLQHLSPARRSAERGERVTAEEVRGELPWSATQSHRWSSSAWQPG